MPQPGVPAVGPMSLITRARQFAPAPMVQRTLRPDMFGPVQVWQDAIGPAFLFTSAKWGTQQWFLEVYMRSTSAKALAQLYDVTAGAAVANSTITVDAVFTNARNRTAALTLTDGHEYRIQFGRQDGGAGAVTGVRLIAI